MGIFGPSKKEKAYAQMMAPQWLRIMEDSAKLVDSTVKPDVYFSRYDLFLENLQKLASVEKMVKFKGMKPSVAYEEAVRKRVQETNDFIQRAFCASQDHADKLTTEKGRTAAIERFFTNMEKYEEHMAPENLAFLESLKK